MTTATPTRSRRGSPQSADKRHARQDELMATLADGVQALTTSDGWRRYLRAMATLRTYSTGNTHISESRECPSSVAAERVPAAAPLALTIATEGRGGAAGDDEAWPGPAARNEWTTDRPMRPGRTPPTGIISPARIIDRCDDNTGRTRPSVNPTHGRRNGPRP